MCRTVLSIAVDVILATAAVLWGAVTLIRADVASDNHVPHAEPFAGQPDRPKSWRPADWEVTVHSRDPHTWLSPRPMDAMHGDTCTPPRAMHTVISYDDAVFICNDHLMTAINASGYGVIYITPGQLVDFAEGDTVIRFNLSTLRTSPRDWIDLWVSPYADHLQLPLEEWLPDLNGPPRHAVHVKMESLNGTTPFKAFVYRNFQEEDLGGHWQVGYERFLEPSALRRDTFELRLSRTHVRFGMPAYDFWWVDTDIADLGWDQGVVQFGHHSYDPTRNCPTCGPNTWHWDNVYISSAIPFTMLRADRRYVDPDTEPGVTFPGPSPAGSRLRFAGVGRNIEVSLDGGATWEPAQLQTQMRYDYTRFQSYWTPIPAGVASVQFRGESATPGLPWMVQDIAIWSREPPAVHP
jgi:hypothetical protein